MLARMKEISSKLRQPFFNWATAHAAAMISVMSGAASAEAGGGGCLRTGYSRRATRSQNGLTSASFPSFAETRGDTAS